LAKKKIIPADPAPSLNIFSTPICLTIGLTWGLLSGALFGFERIRSSLAVAITLPIEQIFQDARLIAPLHLSLNLFELVYFFTLAALGGRRLIRVVQFQHLDLAEELLFGLGLGVGVLSQLALLLGLLGLFAQSVVQIVFVAMGLLILLFELRDPFWKYLSSTRIHTPAPITFSTALAGTIIAGLIVINLLGALGPPVFYDTLGYHFGLPQLYLLNHRIFPTPNNIYSGVPFNSEMLYGLGLALGGERLATLIPWGISIALLYSIYVWARRFSDTKVGLFSALLFYSCPMICVQTWFSLVELNWCFFSFLAIFGLIIALEKSEPLDLRWMAIIGILTGFAMGVKYNAFPMLGILLMVLLLGRLANQDWNLNRVALEAAVFLVTALAVVSPWLIKNWVFYRNPLFPFFHEIFTHALDGPNWRGLLQDAHARNLRTTFSSFSGLLDLFSFLWSREWEAGGIDSMGLAFLLFLPWLFFPKWKTLSAYRPLFLGLALSWIAWSLSSRFPRFFIFAIPLLSILLAQALLLEVRDRRLQQILPLAVVLVCAINCCMIFTNWFNLGGWKVLFGHQTKSDYLQHNQTMYPTPYYAAAEFINRDLPQSAKVLFFEEFRGYYFDRNFIATSMFSSDPFIAQVNKSENPQQIRDYLKSMGVTHIFVNRAELFRREVLHPFSPSGVLVFNSFSNKYLRRVFQKIVTSPPSPMDDRQWVEVYEVL
jgi:hypothetical protein